MTRSRSPLTTLTAPGRLSRRAATTLAFASVSALVLAGCGGGEEGTDGADGGDGGDGKAVVAAIFSGPTNDADYNAVGLAALNAAKAAGAEVSFTEKVAVPDVEARLTEAVGDGATVVWTHGSQFYDATAKVAKNNPDVNFIAEYDGVPKDQPANVWTIDRQFHLGFYGIGVLASKLSKTGTIGYVGGLSLPFSMAEVHAMEQAVKDSGASTAIKPVWTGDFNDAAKAQQFTTQLLGQGADVIVGSLNVGSTGTFQAFEGRAAGDGWVTAKYTDKSAAAGEHYAGSVVYDFEKPLADVLAKIKAGEEKGNYPLGFDTGVTIKLAEGVPADAKAAVDKAMADVKAGTVKVELNTAKIG
ncbi:BMP family ABC transporter substrate-binding protein [Knoellia sp. CPCC 206391]|uniref:BMP family ABC transporter substrate-binding protein n=1 Tax=Knoellia altitudinis TaxID=3404795 RepID=UPI003B43212D